MADEKSETKSESTIRSEVLATERKRARDMRAAFPEAPDFAAEQLEAGATVDEALAAFVPVLREKLTASAARVAQLEGELAAARAESAKPAPAGKKTVLPVAQEGTPGASQGDFMTQARAYAKEHGVGITAAMSAIARDNRELHRSYVASTKTVKEPRE
jgi:hypothetical protein